MINLYINNKSLRLLSLLIIYLQLIACHPPVTNYLTKHQQHAASWVGANLEELILVKGTPLKLEYLGWNKKTVIESEFWTSDMDRYITLFSQINPERSSSKQQSGLYHLYEQLNPEVHWLLIYESSLTDYRSQQRNCVEYYLVNNKGKIASSGFHGTNIGDQKYCKIPLAYPTLTDIDIIMKSSLSSY